mgnify:CR=1 FL=1
MSAIINILADDARDLFGTLSQLLPSKTEAVPIGLQLRNSVLSLTLNNGYVATYCKDVNSSDEWETTFMYQDTHPILTYGDDMTIECDQTGITLTSTYCECSFPVAYSTLSKLDFDNYNFIQMESVKESPIRIFGKLGLERIYKTTYPVYVRDNIAIVKYPSFYAQVRVPEPFHGISLSLAHIALVEKFKAESYSQENPQMLILRRGPWTVALPCTTSMQGNNFIELLDGMRSAMKMSFKDLLDSVRVLSRVKNTDYCTIVIYDGGIRTTVSNSNVTTSLQFGDTTADPVSTFTIPISVWIMMLNAVGDTTAEILLGGGKLCLRNQEVAMLLRVAA